MSKTRKVYVCSKMFLSSGSQSVRCPNVSIRSEPVRNADSHAPSDRRNPGVGLRNLSLTSPSGDFYASSSLTDITVEA